MQRKAIGALARLSAIETAAPFASDAVELAQIARLTGLSDGGGDSLHRLVMDLHKALNGLAAAHAEEVVAGAHVYGAAAAGSPGRRGVHARGRSDPQAEIRSPRAGDDRGAMRARGSPSRTTSAKPMRMWW